MAHTQRTRSSAVELGHASAGRIHTPSSKAMVDSHDEERHPPVPHPNNAVPSMHGQLAAGLGSQHNPVPAIGHNKQVSSLQQSCEGSSTPAPAGKGELRR